uniref:Uncharacterized protein n=1 Tax=Amphimedon queenslandica TaxID=400682 RepID=A0A1X7U2L2_AMPQE
CIIILIDLHMTSVMPVVLYWVTK